MPSLEESQDTKQEFSADDLAVLGDSDDKSRSTGDNAAQLKDVASEPSAKTAKKPAIAVAGDDEPAADQREKKADKIDWPDNWRHLMAMELSAGDDKAYKREMKRLERMAKPTSVYGMYRDLEGKFTSGGLVKVPGKDAKPEDVAEFHKALGVPEKPEDYFKHVKLESGAVIGEADKPIVEEFAAAVHKSGATPEMMNAALNWYYKQQENQAAAMDEADDAFRNEALRELKEEYGPAFKRKTNAIASVFALAEGGTDVSNEKALYARLMGGRTADGKIIGNDPAMVRFLVALAHEINPSAMVVEDGPGKGVNIDAEIASIEQRMRNDRRNYFKDQAAQARYLELIETRNKIRAKG